MLFQVRRLKEFGVTMGEMTRYMDALIKDSEQLAMMIDSVPSVDNLDFIMESDALGHTVMDQLQGHESLLTVAGTVSLEEVLTFLFWVQVSIEIDGGNRYHLSTRFLWFHNKIFICRSILLVQKYWNSFQTLENPMLPFLLQSWPVYPKGFMLME
jgi:hypothetical protein